MADETAEETDIRRHDMESHVSTYDGFLRGSMALVLLCVYVLVALVSFGYGQTLPILLGFGGIILGAIAVIIDIRSGSRSWMLSIGLLVLFALITAINIT